MPGRKWGGVARRGANQVAPQERPQGDRGRKRQQPSRDSRREPPELGPPPAWEPEQWIQEPDAKPVRAEASRAVARGRAAPASGRRRRSAPAEVTKEITGTVGAAHAGKVEGELMEAARAFERERYKDAGRTLRRLAEEAPGLPAVRELYGLTLYRLGRWNEAAKQLEAYRSQTGSVEQHPVLADSYRALGRHKKADALWDELRGASAPGEIVTEGRIVAAGSLADRGDIAGGIRLLERGPIKVKRPRDHHLRLWYALADLYERAGDTPRARDLFGRVVAAAPDFADAAERLNALE